MSSSVRDDETLLQLDKKIVKVHTGRTTSNGNPYCSLELETGDWVFVWEGHWKDEEIEPHKDEYEGLHASLYVVDKSDEDDDDPWYHLKAVAPADPDKAKAMLKRRRLESDDSGGGVNGRQVPRPEKEDQRTGK